MKYEGYSVERRPNARGTNLADQDQPVIIVRGPGFTTTMIGRWTTLCFPGGLVRADMATDDQILEAIVNDEPIY